MDKKISLNINTFIAYKNYIYLNANYYILDKRSKKGTNYLFNTKEPVDDTSIESMIKAMEKAYFKLANKINNQL
jgi:ABC-type uncharacterized transport system auxiliary subunit